MTIEQIRVIDMIADDAEEGIASLVITDHLEWGTNQPDHLLLLQEKINTYITFIESEEIYSEIPDACGKQLMIRVLGLHELPEQVDWFFKRIGELLNERGIGFDFELKVTEQAPGL